jgi:hypothetical protein
VKCCSLVFKNALKSRSLWSVFCYLINNWDIIFSYEWTLRRQQPAEGLVDGDQATEEARLADWHSGFCVNLVCYLCFLGV